MLVERKKLEGRFPGLKNKVRDIGALTPDEVMAALAYFGESWAPEIWYVRGVRNREGDHNVVPFDPLTIKEPMVQKGEGILLKQEIEYYPVGVIACDNEDRYVVECSLRCGNIAVIREQGGKRYWLSISDEKDAGRIPIRDGVNLEDIQNIWKEFRDTDILARAGSRLAKKRLSERHVALKYLGIASEVGAEMAMGSSVRETIGRYNRGCRRGLMLGGR